MQTKPSAMGLGCASPCPTKLAKKADIALPRQDSCSWTLRNGQHTFNKPQECTQRTRRKPQHVVRAAAAPDVPVGVGEIVDVEEVAGIRVLVGDDNRPYIEYLIKWKDGMDPTWEPVANLSDNLLRDFEDKWWKVCRDGEEEEMQKMIDSSREVLPQCVDSNERSALHFAAAIGQAKCCAMLCKAGADVDLADKDGYTPLHMAVGYSHVGCVKALLDAGASPDIPDNQGRNVVQLVDSIRDSMPLTPQLAAKRIALEEVSALLTGNLFEEVLPKKVLESRTLSNGSKEYLVQWMDGTEDSWVKQSDMAKDVVADFEAGVEYATAECLLKMKKRGQERLYLVRWQDNSPDSWEFEDNLAPQLISEFEATEEGQRSLKLEEYQEGGYGQAGLPEEFQGEDLQFTEEDAKALAIGESILGDRKSTNGASNGQATNGAGSQEVREMEGARA